MTVPAEGPRRVAGGIAARALAFRAFSAILALLANVSLPAYRPGQFMPMFGTPSPFWDAFVPHDSGWYYQIARDGYQFVDRRRRRSDGASRGKSRSSPPIRC